MAALRGVLSGGPMPAKFVIDRLLEADHKRDTIFRAFRQLGGVSHKADNKTTWRLPADEEEVGRDDAASENSSGF
jgi:hypothetical protein